MIPSSWNRARGLLSGVLLLASAGCGLLDAPGAPRLVAHRIGSGNYPENSRSALAAALREGYPSLETDLVLTRDRVPVLSHDPWVDAAKCTYTPDSEGAEPRRLPADSRLLIQNLTLEELLRDYRCGGLGDPAKPGAVRVAESYVTLDELLTQVRGHPDVLLHLDIKQDPVFTQSPEVFAEEILSRVNAAALPNPFYISSTEGPLIKAFKARQSVQALLIWPSFSADTSNTVTAITLELQRKLGFKELIQLARDAGADGIAVNYATADRAALESVRQAGMKTAVWTANTEGQLAVFCRWPLDYLITDYVERAPCR
jgi:glycerophosphoryl diester phosphodiesterase